jgi:hypothetical protein
VNFVKVHTKTAYAVDSYHGIPLVSMLVLHCNILKYRIKII